MPIKPDKPNFEVKFMVCIGTYWKFHSNLTAAKIDLKWARKYGEPTLYTFDNLREIK